MGAQCSAKHDRSCALAPTPTIDLFYMYTSAISQIHKHFTYGLLLSRYDAMHDRRCLSKGVTLYISLVLKRSSMELIPPSGRLLNVSIHCSHSGSLMIVVYLANLPVLAFLSSALKV